MCGASWKGFWEPWEAQGLQLSLSTTRDGAPKPASWDIVEAVGHQWLLASFAFLMNESF